MDNLTDDELKQVIVDWYVFNIGIYSIVREAQRELKKRGITQ